jgi:hypothetical protein
MNTFDKKTVENDCEQKEVCEDKLEQEMAFSVEKEEYADKGCANPP